MTTIQSALSCLSAKLQSDPDLQGVNVLPLILQAALQDLTNAEATTRIGAAPYEHTGARVTMRNGTRDKTVETPAGEVSVAIPKLRTGSFFPSLLHPRRRVDKALWSVVCQAWINGVSTRKVALRTSGGGSWGEATGGEEHSEAVVVGVAESSGEAPVEFDDAVDGLGAAVVRATSGEVRQERVTPPA